MFTFDVMNMQYKHVSHPQGGIPTWEMVSTRKRGWQRMQGFLASFDCPLEPRLTIWWY